MTAKFLSGLKMSQHLLIEGQQRHDTAAGMQVADQLTDLKLGNGTSILITANIASALPASVGAAVQQSASMDSSNLVVYGLAFFLTTLGVVYVQEAERQLPMNYASRYRNSELSGQAYLPFKVGLCAALKEPKDAEWVGLCLTGCV